jgi:hypothetical protein
METAQERELQLQGWPFHAMPASFDAGGGSSISSDCFLLGWEPPFDCFADAHLHDLFPFCTCELAALHACLCSLLLQLRPGGEPAVSSPAGMEPLPVSPDATSTPNGELGDLLHVRAPKQHILIFRVRINFLAKFS